MTFESIYAALREENQPRCSPPLDDKEVANIARSISGYPVTEPPPHLTDIGNGQRFARLHGATVRYSLATGWLFDGGKRWSRDNLLEIERKAKDTVRTIYAEAAACEDVDLRQKIANFARQSELSSKQAAMISMARSEPGIAITPDELDRDPWLFNVLNGTIDLRTGELRPHRKEDLITKIAPVVYRPDASCPVWLRFLHTVLNGDSDLLEFIQRAVGYSLTADISEQCFFLAWGSGANGKSTFSDALFSLLGDYAMQSPMETFFAKRADAIPNDVAKMKGARLVAATEGEAGRRLSESLMKQLTGGDRIAARFLHREWFEFTPTAKLWLSTNHKPRIIGRDHAMWRRVRLIPFTVTIPDDQQDKTLNEKLQAELPGILNWALKGCRKWQQVGRLTAPEAIKTATADYREEMDTIGNFIAECCIVSEDVNASAKGLYKAYTEWAEANGDERMSQRAFGLALGESGFTKKRRRDGTVLWVGIGCKEDDE